MSLSHTEISKPTDKKHQVHLWARHSIAKAFGRRSKYASVLCDEIVPVDGSLADAPSSEVKNYLFEVYLFLPDENVRTEDQGCPASIKVAIEKFLSTKSRAAVKVVHFAKEIRNQRSRLVSENNPYKTYREFAEQLMTVETSKPHSSAYIVVGWFENANTGWDLSWELRQRSTEAGDGRTYGAVDEDFIRISDGISGAEIEAKANGLFDRVHKKILGKKSVHTFCFFKERDAKMEFSVVWLGLPQGLSDALQGILEGMGVSTYTFNAVTALESDCAGGVKWVDKKVLEEFDIVIGGILGDRKVVGASPTSPTVSGAVVVQVETTDPEGMHFWDYPMTGPVLASSVAVDLACLLIEHWSEIEPTSETDSKPPTPEQCESRGRRSQADKEVQHAR